MRDDEDIFTIVENDQPLVQIFRREIFIDRDDEHIFEFKHIDPVTYRTWLSHNKRPFGELLGEVGGPPKNGYSILDAEYEIALMLADNIFVAQNHRVVDEHGDPLIIPKKPGVYVVFYKNELVYVGSAKNSLRARIKQHCVSVTEATKIDEKTEIVFRYVVVDDQSACKCIEERLIAYYKPFWNKETPGGPHGFGRHQSDFRKQNPSDWDRKYGRIERTTKQKIRYGE